MTEYTQQNPRPMREVAAQILLRTDLPMPTGIRFQGWAAGDTDPYVAKTNIMVLSVSTADDARRWSAGMDVQAMERDNEERGRRFVDVYTDFEGWRLNINAAEDIEPTTPLDEDTTAALAELVDPGHLEDAAAAEESKSCDFTVPPCSQPMQFYVLIQYPEGYTSHRQLCADHALMTVAGHGHGHGGKATITISNGAGEMVDLEAVRAAVWTPEETLAETYAQGEYDQDRIPTEAGFQEWKARRATAGAS